MEINIYDFDKTIYDGDSTIDFYLFCLKKNIKIIKYLPIQVYKIFLYKIKKITKEEAKEAFFMFLKSIPNVDEFVKKFWDINFIKIKKWYLDSKGKKDVLISASPEFLLNIPAEKLKVKKLIASKVDKNTGKFLSKNCYGEEKVNRLNKEFKNYKIKKAYTDSLSDKPILNLAENSFLVKNNKIKRYIKS